MEAENYCTCGKNTAGTCSCNHFKYTYPNHYSQGYFPYQPQNWPNYGWTCPRCGKVHAPWVSVCGCNLGTINVPTVTFTNTMQPTITTAHASSWYDQAEDKLMKDFINNK